MKADQHTANTIDIKWLSIRTNKYIKRRPGEREGREKPALTEHENNHKMSNDCSDRTNKSRESFWEPSTT